MKRMLALLVISGLIFAGGIVTNTNQSADFVRSLSRNASTDLDAVYFNPAGLTKLDDGLYLSFSNQSISQNRTIHNDLTESTITNLGTDFDGIYEGKVKANIFPDFYMVYKSGKLAYSLGLSPVGGGGGAEFANGLPSIDMMMLSYLGEDTGVLDPALAGFGVISGVDWTQSFTATSTYFGLQFGVSYEVMNNLSIALGYRSIKATDTYDGIIDATFNTTFIGMPEVSNETIVLGEAVGSASTGIIGLNYTIGKTNIGLKYETMTPLVLEYTIDETDNSEMLPETSNNDMPALFGFGVSNQLMSNLSASFSMNYYYNTGVNWDWDDEVTLVVETAEDFVTNGYDMAFGIEYALNDALLLSFGYMQSESGALDEYNSDMSHSLDTNTFGLGAKYSFNDNIDFSVGFLSTSYVEGVNVFNATYPANETYNRDAVDFAFGIQYKF